MEPLPTSISINDGFLNLKVPAQKVQRYKVVLNSDGQRREITDPVQLERVVNALKLLNGMEITDLSKITLKQDGIETEEVLDPNNVADRTAAVAKRTIFPFDEPAKLKYHEAIDFVFKNTVKTATADSIALEADGVSAIPPPSSSKVERVVKAVFSAIGNFFRRIGSGIEAGAKWVWSHTFGALLKPKEKNLENLNPLKEKDDPGVKLARNKIKMNDNRDLLTDHLHLYERDGEYATHDVSIIMHTNKFKVPDTVKFIIAKAVLGPDKNQVDLVEANVVLDIRDFLIEYKDKEECEKRANVLFQVFNKLANATPPQREAVWNELKGQLDFLAAQNEAEQKLEDLKGYFFGKLDEVDGKLRALTTISSPEQRKEMISQDLIRERKEIGKLLNQKMDRPVLEFLLKLVYHAEETTGVKMYDSQKLLAEINNFIEIHGDNNQLFEFIHLLMRKKEEGSKVRQKLMGLCSEGKYPEILTFVASAGVQKQGFQKDDVLGGGHL